MPEAVTRMVPRGGCKTQAQLSAQMDYVEVRQDEHGNAYLVQLLRSERHQSVPITEDEREEFLASWLEETGEYVAAQGTEQSEKELTTHMVVSFPPETPDGMTREEYELRAHRAARAWAWEAFGTGNVCGNFDYYTAFHTDKGHPHLHVIVNRRANPPIAATFAPRQDRWNRPILPCSTTTEMKTPRTIRPDLRLPAPDDRLPRPIVPATMGAPERTRCRRPGGRRARTATVRARTHTTRVQTTISRTYLIQLIHPHLRLPVPVPADRTQPRRPVIPRKVGLPQGRTGCRRTRRRTPRMTQRDQVRAAAAQPAEAADADTVAGRASARRRNAPISGHPSASAASGSGRPDPAEASHRTVGETAAAGADEMPQNEEPDAANGEAAAPDPQDPQAAAPRGRKRPRTDRHQPDVEGVETRAQKRARLETIANRVSARHRGRPRAR